MHELEFDPRDGDEIGNANCECHFCDHILYMGWMVLNIVGANSLFSSISMSRGNKEEVVVIACAMI